MRRVILLGAFFLVLIFLATGIVAANDSAESLRKAKGLVVYMPPASFMNTYFTADEQDPAYVFGTVRDFVQSLKCPTVWLIEKDVKNRAMQQTRWTYNSGPPEYVMYLECDQPDGVVHYAFSYQEPMPGWRKMVRGHNANGVDDDTCERLKKASFAGMPVGSKLRFIMKNGEVMRGQTPEDALRTDLSFAPRYDLKRGRKISK